MILPIISVIASVTSVVSLIPQIYQTYRTRSARDLSLLMLINFLICSISWVIYGLLTEMWTVYLTNIIMTLFSIILIVFKVRFTPKKKTHS